MGWSGGSGLMRVVIDAVKANVPNEETRSKIYDPIIEAFCDEDWDTQNECLGRDVAFDSLISEDEDEDDDDDDLEGTDDEEDWDDDDDEDTD